MYDKMREIAAQIIRTVERKNKEYGESWRKRGGVGAFMMAARKWDRLETQVQGDVGYDIFALLTQENLTSEDPIDTIDDLIAYLLMIRAHCAGETLREMELGAEGQSALAVSMGLSALLDTRGETVPEDLSEADQKRVYSIWERCLANVAGSYRFVIRNEFEMEVIALLGPARSNLRPDGKVGDTVLLKSMSEAAPPAEPRRVAGYLIDLVRHGRFPNYVDDPTAADFANLIYTEDKVLRWDGVCEFQITSSNAPVFEALSQLLPPGLQEEMHVGGTITIPPVNHKVNDA